MLNALSPPNAEGKKRRYDRKRPCGLACVAILNHLLLFMTAVGSQGAIGELVARQGTRSVYLPGGLLAVTSGAAATDRKV